ncbi:MAG: hypothetical protein ACI3VP_02830, partial [Oscillospiraceae bacterium]
ADAITRCCPRSKAEATTSEISKQKAPEAFCDSRKIAREGGKADGETRRPLKHGPDLKER